MMQIKGFSLIQYAQVIRQLSLLAVNVLLTKNLLTTTQIGQYEWLWYFNSALTFAWTSGIIQYASATIRKSNDPNTLKNIFWLLQLLSTVSFLAVLAVKPNAEGWLYFFLYQFFNNPSLILEYIYYWEGKNKALFYVSTVSNLFFIVFLTLPLYYNFSISIAYLLLFVVGFVRWLLLIWHLQPIQRPQIKIIFDHFKLAFPLILYALLGSFSVILDGWLLEYYYNDANIFAIYRYGAKELPNITTLSVSFSLALIPMLSSNMTSGLQILKSKSKLMMPLFFLPAIVIICYIREIFTFFYSPVFLSSIPIFKIYLLMAIVRSIFPQSIMNAKGYYKQILMIAIIEIGINVIASVLLINKIGMIGLAWGTFIAFFSEKIMQMIYLWRKDHIKISDYVPYSYYIYSVLLLVLYYYS
ncbi:MAG: polysaccharide biosynthesis C-terminal domain-containing protein [Saprospiraceae bacterium]|nr:polysaccharide biosynthesis C-terminal domain-containing protein [Saprospiraceae bacterium]